MSKWLGLLNKHGTTDAEILAEYDGRIDAQNISYDFFKNLTSLSIVTLGGVLTLSEKVFADRVGTTQMFVAAGLIAASGITALQCQADIVQVARGEKKPDFWLRWGHRLAPALFGAGVGGFLVLLTGAFD